MKTVSPRRLVAMTLMLALAVVVTGCTDGSPSSAAGEADAAPIRVKQPGSGEKSGTAPACGGVTEHGICEDGSALVCDVTAGELRRTDCEALGQRCVVDSATGATCQDVGEGSCDSGLDFAGFCDGEVARWCDDEGEKSWDCAADGLACATDVCEEGAFCCGSSEAHPECEALGFSGECGGEHGQVARYCSGGELIELDCGSDATYSCQFDACADGAYCCPGELECPSLGFDGECSGDTVRYCGESGAYREVVCTDFGMVCGTDCAGGADCCDLNCADAGIAGTCVGEWLVYCDTEELFKINCPEDEPGTTCVPAGVSSGFAHCGG